MIKVQATINGVISKSATHRTAGDGKKFISFPVKLTVPGSRNNMPGKELTVSVSKDGDESELTAFAAGTRIDATGTLTFRKAGDNLYFNFHADTVNLSPESNKDASNLASGNAETEEAKKKDDNDTVQGVISFA